MVISERTQGYIRGNTSLYLREHMVMSESLQGHNRKAFRRQERR